MRSGLLSILLLYALSGFGQDQVVPDTTTTVVTGTSKTSDEPAFSVIAEKKQIAVRKLQPEKVAALKQSDDYWYANLEPKKREAKKAVEPSAGLLNKAWFLNLLWLVVLVAFIAVVIWYLALSNISLFRKQPKTISEETEENTIDEDIFSIPYDKEISKATVAGNYRLAVRLWYLQTLRELADRNLIVYRADKTNSEYLNALLNGPHHRNFFRLTRSFEYTWYGQFPIAEDAYKDLQTEFRNFINSLRS